MRLGIVAVHQETRERIPVTDLTWFQAQGVRDWEGQGDAGAWWFEIVLDDWVVYTTQPWECEKTVGRENRETLQANNLPAARL